MIHISYFISFLTNLSLRLLKVHKEVQILNLSQIGRLFLIKNMKSVHNPRKTLFKCTLDSLYYKNGNIIVCPCDNIGYSYLLDISIKQPEALFSRISNFEHCKLLRRLLVLMCNHYTLYKNIGKNCLAVTIIYKSIQNFRPVTPERAVYNYQTV